MNIMMKHLFRTLPLILAVSHCVAFDHSRAVDISNESGHKLQVYWLRPETGEAVRYADVLNGDKAVINSFVNHTFMLRDESSSCEEQDENCHVNYITISDEHKRQRKYRNANFRSFGVG